MRNEILKILDECRAEIVTNMQAEGVTVTGKTSSSLAVEDRGEHLVLLQRPEGAPIETTQFGRPKGKVPQGFKDIIRQWILDKGITPKEAPPYKRKESVNWIPKYTPQERNLMRAAGAIAYVIANGSKKIPEGGTQRHRNPKTNIYTEPIDKAIDKISNFLLTEITTNIRK